MLLMPLLSIHTRELMRLDEPSHTKLWAPLLMAIHRELMPTIRRTRFMLLTMPLTNIVRDVILP